MDAIPQGVTYATLGGSVVAMAGLVIWGLFRRVLKRSEAEGALDQRLPVILDTALTPWKEAVTMQKSIIDEERKEKQRAQDEREQITKQLIEYATVTTRQHASDLAQTRDQFTESQRRLYARVEQGEKHHQECTHKLDAALEKINQLEQRQYNTALLTPVAAVPAVPVASQATSAFNVPATGLTITPGLSPNAHPA